MSEEQNLEVLELVKEAQSKKVFDITKFAKGKIAPQDTVTGYLDIDSAYRLNAINEKMADAANDPELYAKLEVEAAELTDKILQSKVTFHMRGVNQSVIEEASKYCNEKFPPKINAIGQEEPTADWFKNWTARLVAANLIKVVNADGAEDEREFTVEDVLEVRASVPTEVWDLIVEKMQQLSLANAYFKGLTDAGFLPKS